MATRVDEQGYDLGEVDEAAVAHFIGSSAGATEEQIRLVLVKLTAQRANHNTTMWQGKKISMATWDEIIRQLREKVG